MIEENKKEVDIEILGEPEFPIAQEDLRPIFEIMGFA